jgi:viroplasmin and RNaseH domain-containing protein
MEPLETENTETQEPEVQQNDNPEVNPEQITEQEIKEAGDQFDNLSEEELERLTGSGEIQEITNEEHIIILTEQVAELIKDIHKIKNCLKNNLHQVI